MKPHLLKIFSILLAAVMAITISCGGGSTSSSDSYSTIDADLTKTPTPSASYYNAPSVQLGLTFSGTSVTFTTWDPNGAPTLCLYAASDQSIGSPSATYVMTASTDSTEGGIYRTTLASADYSAFPYYDYYSAAGSYYLDPYAPSMAKWVGATSADSIGKGAITDVAAASSAETWTSAGSSGVYFDGTKMKGTDGTTASSYSYLSNRDAIIYEAGVRDFTVDTAGLGYNSTGIDLGLSNPFGTYKAFTEILPHIQKLGVTHVQILCPLQNFNYNDNNVGTRETATGQTSNSKYNWGYDPQNYFTVSGMYSANPGNPASRVNEFMTMVNAIHAQGMGCIVDVVFNHTASTSVLPSSSYYYRNGKNGSGCGNDTRSEAKMMRKLIIDATVNLVKNYKVDGLRFDLMGLIDNETIAAAYKAARDINPKVIFVGEGWIDYTGASSDYNGASIYGSDQEHASFFGSMQLSMFSDSIRNILKNGYPKDGAPSFIQGAAQDLASLFKNISGISTNTTSFTRTTTDGILNYMTAHDNLTLYDTICCATGLANTADATVLKRARIGYAVLMTSQGSTFIHGGDEMFRSKETTASSGASNTKSSAVSGRVFCDNSYDASDAINRIAWANVYSSAPISGGFTNYNTSANGYKLYKYVQGLITLRKSTDAFRLGLSDAAIAGKISTLSASTGTSLSFAYKAVDSASSKTYYVFHNASTVSVAFPVAGVDFTAGTVIVDDDEAGTSAVSAVSGVTPASGSVTVAALTSAVIKM